MGILRKLSRTINFVVVVVVVVVVIVIVVVVFQGAAVLSPAKRSNFFVQHCVCRTQHVVAK